MPLARMAVISLLRVSWLRLYRVARSRQMGMVMTTMEGSCQL